uniref:G-patch domain-containing protein n=1 Tax=Leptobrachium leishanense TaxID=445787 RepID=A0A8C5MDB0_9ANUR
MAMLAEPRRKQKWSVDPRNSAWSKDESKFGQKMLEKMGWSKGKGLGAQEQGSTDHIKVQVKNNTFGLGVSVNHEDNWIAHQDDFNQILAELNNCHSTTCSEVPSGDEKKSFNLEEKSKSSKKRVHYMKFAKGKDLSSRTDTDLACIFGKREKTKRKAPEVTEEPEAPSEEQDERQSPTQELESGNTVTSTLSVNEYFAKRMAELKKSQAHRSQSSTRKVEECQADSTESPSEDASTKKSRKKKRNRKNGYIQDDFSVAADAVDNIADEDDQNATEGRERRKKSKKSKTKELHDEDTECVGEREEDDYVGEVSDEKKKNKKRKKKNRKERRASPELIEEDDSPTQIEEPKQKKKKKQSC